MLAAPLFNGCVAMFDKGRTYKAYAGPALALDQIAVLKLDNDKGGIKYCGIAVSGIDGKNVHYKFGESIQLLPGTHTIVFYYSMPLAVSSSSPISRSVVLLAGKTYRARTSFPRTSSITTTRRAGNTTYGYWSVEITEGQ
jgi:hypothetical protein